MKKRRTAGLEALNQGMVGRVVENRERSAAVADRKDWTPSHGGAQVCEFRLVLSIRYTL